MKRIEIEKGEKGFYLTDGFMAIVAKRFATEKRAINYAKKNYGRDIIARYADSKIPESLSEIIEKNQHKQAGDSLKEY